ncbi:hypothetical protein U9M48_041095 [Paspalum notatum var. saurae]|uniref:BED-type domain-containing protein n=1 Tax=Paspalum notatum var. saurae TaxID=547442 RepID=A0AAQ3UMH0_PASNO
MQSKTCPFLLVISSSEFRNMEEQATTQRRTGAPMKRRAGVWVHFNETRDGDGNVTAECKECKAKLVGDHGTSSLWKHAELCHGAVRSPKRPKQLPPPCPPSRSSRCESSERETGLREDEEASRDLARMIALHGFDPSIVEDDHFRSFVRRLNPGFKVPSRCDVEVMCDGILDAQERLHKQFEVQCKLLSSIQEKLQMIQCRSSKEEVQSTEAAPICSAQETAAVGASPPLPEVAVSVGTDEEAGAGKRSATADRCVVEVASSRRAVLQSAVPVSLLGSDSPPVVLNEDYHRGKRPYNQGVRLRPEAGEWEDRGQEVTRLQRPETETQEIRLGFKTLPRFLQRHSNAPRIAKQKTK